MKYSCAKHIRHFGNCTSNQAVWICTNLYSDGYEKLLEENTVGQPEGALNGPLWARNHMSDSRYLLLISFSGARLGLPFIVN